MQEQNRFQFEIFDCKRTEVQKQYGPEKKKYREDSGLEIFNNFERKQKGA